MPEFATLQNGNMIERILRMGTGEKTAASNKVWDVIIIGGGPAGALAGMALTQRGRSAIILEKSSFPRFHVGESFLPDTFDLLKELGLESAIRQLPHMPKFGAEFAMGYGGRMLDIDFAEGFCKGKETFNIERSIFDEMLLTEAGRRGTVVRQNTAVKKILGLHDGDVRVTTESGEEIRGRYLFDASGQGTVVARHLGNRQAVSDPKLQKIAYVNHFENVQRSPGKKAGNPLIVMMDEGWFWVIPISESRTSVGMVLDAEVGRRLSREENTPPEKMLQWGISRCPVMLERMCKAIGPQTNNVVADFSYTCKPFAGQGYFLIGDAAAFMDPIFSTGIFVAAHGAMSAVGLVDDILNNRSSPTNARKIYTRQIEQCTSTLFKLIRQYYDHSFRELFLMGEGPAGVHKAMIGLLAGNVFPRPPFKLRWRIKMFDFFVALNRKRQVVPRRRRFSIAKSELPAVPA